MFLADPSITDRFQKTEEAASAFRTRFKTRLGAKKLLPEAKALGDLFDELVGAMPKESIFGGNARRHLGFLAHYLEKGQKKECASDIEDLCDRDLPAMREYYHQWLAKSAAVDAELQSKVMGLLTKREFDSAIRKAFIVLTERLRDHFALPKDKDGPELVNLVFGSKSTVPLPLDAAQKQAYRDLFSGLYGVHRNKYAHNDCNPDWIEVLGLVSFLNLALRELAVLSAKKTT